MTLFLLAFAAVAFGFALLAFLTAAVAALIDLVFS